MVAWYNLMVETVAPSHLCWEVLTSRIYQNLRVKHRVSRIIDVIHAQTTLDNLYAENLIPPLGTIFLDIIDFEVRSRELTCSPPFAEFIVQELFPWIQQDYHITSSPAQRIIGGFSFGGLAAAFIGLRHPELFGNVLSQSGSFWWKPEGDIEHEWLTHQLAVSDKLPLNFYLDVGLLET